MTPEDYVNAGWYIFPCHSIERGRCTCRKGRDCTSPGKHPRTTNGVNDATNDIQTVQMWKVAYPNTNWGVAAGRQSGIVIVDIDPKHGGFASFDEFETMRPEGPLPQSLRATSGGGGRHIYFSYPSDGVSLGNRVDWLPGVDIRSDGGYVVLPPGNHISGGLYQWTNWGSPMAVLPSDVAEAIRSSSRKTTSAPLADSTSILDGVPEGSRDDTLFRWACRLRRQHSGDSDGGRAVVTALVLQAASNSVPPFPEDEALAKVEQAFSQDHSDPFDDLDDDDPIFRLTDMGNRDRLLRLHGDNIRYVGEMGWFMWSDLGWVSVAEHDIIKLAEDISTYIRKREAVKVADLKLRKKIERWAESSESSGSLTAAVKLTKGDQRVLRQAHEFDVAGTDLACANGIVDLRTGRIRPFLREDLITKNTGVIYDPDADMDWWLEFIATSTQGDTEMMEYLQLAAGYTLTGSNTQECFFIIGGPPSSGKSTYIDGLMTAMGTYATTSQSDTFMYRRGKDAAPNELARLQSTRLVSVSEIREGDYFNEPLIKQVTGGDSIQARHLYMSGFTYVPQFKLWFATNHVPMSSDEAMLRRIKRVKFPRTIPYEERDPRLKLHVRDKDAGSPAVLRWAIEGARKFLETGQLKEPALVTLAAHEFKVNNDVMALFLNDRLQEDQTSSVSMRELFTVWFHWCREMNENPQKVQVFRERLRDRGYNITLDDHGAEHVRGVRLITGNSFIDNMGR